MQRCFYHILIIIGLQFCGGILSRAQGIEVLVVDTVAYLSDSSVVLERGYYNSSNERDGEWERIAHDTVLVVQSFWKKGEIKSTRSLRKGRGYETVTYRNSGEIRKVEIVNGEILRSRTKYNWPKGKRAEIRVYHKNGVLKEKGQEGTFRKTLGCLGLWDHTGRVGRWVFYDSSGKKTKVIRYEKGEIVKVKE